MHGSLPVRYLGDIPLVKLAIAVGYGESDSRRTGCRNQKPYRNALPYEITPSRAHSRGNADHGELPAVDGISMPTDNGVNYFRVAEAITSCATAPSSFV